MSAVAKETPAPPVRGEALTALTTLAQSMSREQLWWSSGYFAGLAAAHAPPALAVVPAAKPEPEQWLVLYATETGNARRVAQRLDAALREAGVGSTAADLRDYDPKALRRARNVTFVVATHGLGDAPEGTESFFAYWHGARAPRLEGLRYAVLALGDSSYEDYCAVGKALDARLEALGAQRLLARVDCDVDYEAPAEAWHAGVVRHVADAGTPARAAAATPPAAPSATAPTRDAPFASPVLVSQKITGRHSTKDVRHVELSLEGSGLAYEPGDAIGVWPENPPALVTAVLEAARLDRDAVVAVGAETLPLGEALTRRLELTQLGRATLLAYAEVAGANELTDLVADPAGVSAYLATRQVLDLLLEFPARLEAQRFAGLLRKLTPRLYSAASSPAANPDEVHLTVGVVRYERFGRMHGGAASAFLAATEDRVPVYVEPNAHFRLPADGATRVIMIGAGTGVAPFRAFLQHRVANGARGENWLFFGDRTLRDDFLYQVEWQRYAHDGALTRLDVAFSRDQQAKVYVQQRLRERAAEVYDWLEQGAHVYVCGDAEQLAPDVHAALRDVVRSVGGRSADAAEEYLQRLKAAKRYQRDVY